MKIYVNQPRIKFFFFGRVAKIGNVCRQFLLFAIYGGILYHHGHIYI